MPSRPPTKPLPSRAWRFKQLFSCFGAALTRLRKPRPLHSPTDAASMLSRARKLTISAAWIEQRAACKQIG